MPQSLTLLAPAKLNLFLHILGQREDGYHSLQTVFQLVDLYDELEFEATADGKIMLDAPDLGIDVENNLVYRAARALQEAAFPGRSGGDLPGACIRLTKHIPAGAGLGGGSSDAATTLLGLNTLWNAQLPPHRLLGLAARLGADVPVFVGGRSCWAEGIGEQLRPLELGQRYYLILKPDCNISTAEVFGHPDLTRDTSPSTIAAFLSGATPHHNDCQPLVSRNYPAVAQAIECLNGSLKGFTQAILTGTGASVFAEFPGKERAAATLAQLQGQLPASWQAFVVSGLDTAPAHLQMGWFADQ